MLRSGVLQAPLRRRWRGSLDDSATVELFDLGPAMLEEARAAESKRDFISKSSIALKEARESHVRLRVCRRCNLGPAGDGDKLVSEANQIVAILTAIIRNTRRNAELKKTARNGRKSARIPNS